MIGSLPLLASVGILVILFDAQNALARWRRHVVDVIRETTSDDFTLCITIYGDPRYFCQREWLAQYQPNVLVIAQDIPEEFLTQLRADGWRVLRVRLPIASPPAMIREAIDRGEVRTTWAVRLDADTISRGDVRQVIATLERSGADVASVKTHVLNAGESVWTHLQQQEYRMSMLGRHNRPWCLSGAFFIARTELLRRIYHRHSCWFFGEDSETGIVARRMRARIVHLDFEVLTEAPATLRALLRQRRGWWAGSFRQSWINFPHMIRYPLWLTYNCLLVWLMLAGKALDLSKMTVVLPVIYVAYVAITAVANWPVRSEWMLVYPLYAMAQAIIMPPVGLVHYIGQAIRYRTADRYRMPYLGGVPEPKPF